LQGLSEPVLSLRLIDGGTVERPLRHVVADQILNSTPWRTTRSIRGQAHFPGSYWAAPTGTLVIYESRLELARLLLADFDPGVTGIAAQ
jgi:hypothetical protein